MKIYLISIKKARRALAFFLMLVLSLGITAAAVRGVGMVSNEDVVADTVPTDKPLIIIDAGHGGEDPGATGTNGREEKEINLELAITLKAQLEEKGYTVVMTRTEDKMLYSESENIKGMRKLSDLKNRVKMVEEYPNALLVSIHMNSFGEAQYSGLQVYHQDDSNSSAALANSIQNAVRREVQKDNERVVKNGKGLYLLDNSPNTAVLIECGFLTNPEECEKLCEKEYQKQLSFAIVCGIIEYIDSIKS